MSKSISPLITIIVPVYNVEEYLRYCIESIIHQTYKNLEILLLDDGSTDSSLQICRDFESKDNRCKVYHNENHGVAYTRNLGIQIAKGEYISFIDSDDYIDESFIETLYSNIVKADADFAMVGYQTTYSHDFQQIHRSNKIQELTQRQFFNFLYHRFPCGLDYNDDTLFIIVTNKLYKKQLLEGISFPSYILSEDLYFNNLIFLRAQKAVFIRENLYYYFQRTSSVSHVINKKYIQGLQAYFDSLRNIPVENNEYRAACLTKLYKAILSTRYLMRNISDKKDIDNIIKDIKNQTITEMIQSKFIPLSMKLFFLSFYKIPILYNLLMRLCELRAKF